MTPVNPPATADRVHVIDVLRGIALLGMFLVHFNDYSSDGGTWDASYRTIVALFFEERFWTMFGILFGVGFAIQLQRADARRDAFVHRYLRRLAGLAAFGVIAHGIFGFNVLLGYAMWGLALLLVRNWSTRALVIALVVSAVSGSVYLVATAAYDIAEKGEQAYTRERNDLAARDRALLAAYNEAVDSTAISTVIAARLRRMPWFYTRWYSFLPVNTLTLFLLGLLGFRLGLFHSPAEHRRLIVGLMAFGVASWAFQTWVPPRPPTPGMPLVREMIVSSLAAGFGLIRTMWLTFLYVGAVLLLVSRNPAWLRRLSMFGWTGRMALTNYMVQIATLDLLFDNYALGLSMRPIVGLMAAIALFLIDAAVSRWWLARHPHGPLEWLWRCITCGEWQPWRLESIRSAATTASL